LILVPAHLLERDLVLLDRLDRLLDRLLEDDLPLFRDRDLDLFFERFFDFFLFFLRLLDLDRLEDELDELLDLLFPDFRFFLDRDRDRDELELLEELDDRDRRERFLEVSLDLDLDLLASETLELSSLDLLPLLVFESSFPSFLSSSGSPHRSYLERSPSSSSSSSSSSSGSLGGSGTD